MDGGANPAALDRWVAWTMVAGNEQQQAVTVSDCLIETPIDCAPCDVEGHAVKVEHAVGLHCPIAQTLVPAAVEGSLT